MNGVSVIVATYNRRDLLVEVVKSILYSENNKNEPRELIVIYDHNEDGSRDAINNVWSDYESGNYKKTVHSYTGDTLDGERQGQAAALNTGIQMARYDKVFLADDDRIFDKRFFDIISPNILLGQACTCLPDDQTFVTADGYVFFGAMFTGLFGVARKDAITIGGFDEHVSDKWGFSDIEFARRLDMLGVKFKVEFDAKLIEVEVPYNVNPRPFTQKRKESVLNDIYFDEKYLDWYDDIWLGPSEGNEYPHTYPFLLSSFNKYRFLGDKVKTEEFYGNKIFMPFTLSQEVF